MKYFQYLITIARVTYGFTMTALLITLAIAALLLTWNQKIPLMMAHYLWGPTMLFSAGSKLKVTGLSHLDLSKPYVFVMNHQSTLDIPIILTAIPTPLRFIVKKEIMFAPFVGIYVWAMGMIFVDRSNHKRAIHSLKRAGHIIRSGASIIAYPEGTRSKDGTILPFKKGSFVTAIEAGVPVVPIAVEGSRFVMPKNSFNLKPQNIRLSIGQPIPTTNLSKHDLESLMTTTRNTVIELHKAIGGLGGPTSNITPNIIQSKIA